MIQQSLYIDYYSTITIGVINEKIFTFIFHDIIVFYNLR